MTVAAVWCSVFFRASTSLQDLLKDPVSGSPGLEAVHRYGFWTGHGCDSASLRDNSAAVAAACHGLRWRGEIRTKTRYQWNSIYNCVLYNLIRCTRNKFNIFLYLLSIFVCDICGWSNGSRGLNWDIESCRQGLAFGSQRARCRVFTGLGLRHGSLAKKQNFRF